MNQQLKRKETISWTKNWSARGIVMMNRMENYGNSSSYKTVELPSFAKKLSALIEIYPYNGFYKSLKSQMNSMHSLSSKQLQAIDNGYNLLLKK